MRAVKLSVVPQADAAGDYHIFAVSLFTAEFRIKSRVKREYK
jgi:hypothetical protein